MPIPPHLQILYEHNTSSMLCWLEAQGPNGAKVWLFGILNRENWSRVYPGPLCKFIESFPWSSIYQGRTIQWDDCFRRPLHRMSTSTSSTHHLFLYNYTTGLLLGLDRNERLNQLSHSGNFQLKSSQSNSLVQLFTVIYPCLVFL